MDKKLLEKAKVYAKSICGQIDDLKYKASKYCVNINHDKVGRIAYITEREKLGRYSTGVLQIVVGCYGRRKIYPEKKNGEGLGRQNVLDEINRIIESNIRGQQIRKRESREWDVVRQFMIEKTGNSYSAHLDVGRFKVFVASTSGCRISVKFPIELEDYDAIIEAIRNIK